MLPVGNIPLTVTSGTFSADTTLYSNPGMWESWSLKVRFTLNSGKMGFGRSGNSTLGNRNTGFFLDSTTSQMAFYSYHKFNSGVYTYEAPVHFNYNASHIYELTVRFSRRYVSAVLKNTNTGEIYTTRYSPTDQNLLFSMFGYPGIITQFAVAGQVTLQSATLYVEDDSQPDVVFMGDSLNYSPYMPQNALGYPQLHFDYHGLKYKGSIWAAPNLTSTGLNASMTEYLLRYTPKKVFIQCGTNDVLTAPSTWTPQYTSVVNSLQGIGATVIPLQIPPGLSGTNSTKPTNEALLGIYPNAVDTRSPFLATGEDDIANPAYFWPSVGHFNILGNQMVAGILQNL